MTPHTGVRAHREIHLILTQKVCFYCLVLIEVKGAMQATGGENQASGTLISDICELHNDWFCKTCCRGAVDLMGIINHFLVTRRNPSVPGTISSLTTYRSSAPEENQLWIFCLVDMLLTTDQYSHRAVHLTAPFWKFSICNTCN